jgi:1-acyl-sn-glycerol-3-phosphate acyltransferase
MRGTQGAIDAELNRWRDPAAPVAPLRAEAS